MSGRGGGPDLALALGFAIALNAAYLGSGVLPINDTFYDFANFQIFYSELLFHGDLARWLPYGTYGLQADYEQIAALSPLSYAVGAVGALLGATDTLLLFKLAAIGEQLLFTFGVWRLARGLFTERATVLVLSLAAAGTTLWYAQQWWDLRIYALLPLVLAFGLEFVETRRPARLWLAGITGVVWCLGALPYWIPLWALTLLIVGAVAVRGWPATLRALARQGPRDLALLAAFAAAAGAYAWFVLHALDATVLRAEGRDPVTGQVDLATFRSYGGGVQLAVVARALLFGWPVHLPWGSGADNSVYLGLAPLLGLAVALARERSRTFFALLAGALALVWLSLGGAFAALVYHLPGFAYYRHVGLTFGLVKVLLLIASGYGLDRVFARGGPRLASVGVGAVVLLAAAELLTVRPQWLGANPWAWIGGWGGPVLIRIGAYGALLAAASATRLSRGTAVALALVLDLGLYQLAAWRGREPQSAGPELLAAADARAPHYQPDRRAAPVDPRRPETDTPENRMSANALALAEATRSRELYWFVYPWSSFDPCRGAHRTDYYQPGVDRLLALDRDEGGRLGALLGCGVPKLRVVADARIASGPDDARAILRSEIRAGHARPTVIEAPAGEAPPAFAGDAGRARMRRFGYGALEAEVEVAAPGGAWLVYDDAFHPGWRATVNGVAAEIRPANLAWKAVRVPPGASRVRFVFRNGANHALGTALAFFGLGAGAWLVGWMLREAARVRPRSDGPA